MSTIVLLQGLHSEASSQDVRGFFAPLQIMDGGVHITTSDDGSVFVTFKTRVHAEEAVNVYHGGRILGDPVELSICSVEQRDLILSYLDEQGKLLEGFELDDMWRSKDGGDPPWLDKQSDSGDPPWLDKQIGSGDPPWLDKQSDGGDPLWLDKQSSPIASHGQNLALALADERNKAHRNESYYVRIRNLSPNTTVQNVMTFLKGIEQAILVNSIILRNEVADTKTIVAFVKLNKKDAFETALRMDESYLNGNCLVIRGCSQEMYNLEKRRPPVHNLTPPPNFHNYKKLHHEEGFKERKIEKQYDIVEHPSNQDKQTTYKHQKPLSYTVQKEPNEKRHQNEFLPDAKRIPHMNQPVSDVQKIAIPILFLVGLDDSISPRDIRNMFGELAEFIPSSGILIRTHIMRVDAYVAFVWFLDLVHCQHAAIIWKAGYRTQTGTKISLSMCTERILQDYGLENTWQLHAADQGTKSNKEHKNRSTYLEPQSQSRSPPSDLGVMPREVPMTSENELLCNKPTKYEVSNQAYSPSPQEELSTLPRDNSEMRQAEHTSSRRTSERPLDRKQVSSYSGSLVTIPDQGQLRSFESPQLLSQSGSSAYSVIETFIRCSQMHSRNSSPIEGHSGHRPARKQDQGKSNSFRSAQSCSQLHTSRDSPIKSSRIPSPKMSRSRSSIEGRSEHRPARKRDQGQFSSFPSTQSFSQLHTSNDSPKKSSKTYSLKRSRSRSPIEGRYGYKPSRKSDQVQLTSFQSHHSSNLSGSSRNSPMQISPGGSPIRSRSPPIEGLSGHELSPIQKPPHNEPPASYDPPCDRCRPGSRQPTVYTRSPPGPEIPPPGPEIPPAPSMPPPAPIMPRPAPIMPPSGPMSPLGPRTLTPGARMPPFEPWMPFTGPWMPPPGSRMPPPGPRLPSCGPWMPPCGPRIPPCGPWMPPPGPRMSPLGPTVLPPEISMPPLGDTTHSGYAATHSVSDPSTTDGGGHYVRVSPLPEWANEAWIYKLFGHCGVKDRSLLIKFKESKPKYAYLEFETNADVAKALLMNGIPVENTRIFVERIGDF